ncbi:hypothetical protein IAQ61_003589 [Plenodomus lingam]|uniref:Uncharacterized protein n=1 Tax=Leptosphaeria maculans (strain JN3 / isolate v23.1.3 / race Av1-4-5-6-7-8) TaxID=985895 RepID=E4ZR37_LEPMJ|nr:hypothetical protein LEMA_P033760.1 [Plenodomus lingam JN3]KAH9874400.1 hypothetical protein IAQ61_003589 [Plenodomus lingam]CBX93702.1 hypothetical protein LEMA_P033760.1 [Plenodomus lingam JN3]
MPYIIQVPGIPRPYITNDPRIYLDCARVFHWPCEARPFSDSYCKLLRDQEEKRHEGERRRDQLESHYFDQLDHMRLMEAAATPLPEEPEGMEAAAVPGGCTVGTGKHAKHDSVQEAVIDVAQVSLS